MRENLAHLHPLHLAPVDVAACAQAAVRAASLPDGVRVQLHDLDALPTVIAGQRSLTLVFANLLLPWLADLPAGLSEIRRLLRADGVFAFSLLGPTWLRLLAARGDTTLRFISVITPPIF